MFAEEQVLVILGYMRLCLQKENFPSDEENRKSFLLADSRLLGEIPTRGFLVVLGKSASQSMGRVSEASSEVSLLRRPVVP